MNKSNKYLLVTFDYELFLGKRSGTVTECLIEPTNKILRVLKQYNIRAIFFVDTVYLLKLCEHNNNSSLQNDYNQVIHQLTDIVKQNHYIFPHLHPHWLDAKYNSTINQWDLSESDKYKFADLDFKLQSKLFSESIQLLKNVINSASVNQKIDGYRAGGWSVQPFDVFKKQFELHGIINDFSVLPGIYHFSQAQSFDYSNCKTTLPYSFDNSICQENTSGKFNEFPISIIGISPLTQFYHKLFIKYYSKFKKDSSFNRGIGQTAIKTNKAPSNNSGMELGNYIEYLSIDFLSRGKEKVYLKYIISHEFVHFLSHPKLFTNHSIQTFSNLLKQMHHNHNIVSNYNQINENY